MNFFSHRKACGDSCCLRVQNLSVTIGGDKILENINMHVHCGEMVALIGPNGAGKSIEKKQIGLFMIQFLQNIGHEKVHICIQKCLKKNMIVLFYIA